MLLLGDHFVTVEGSAGGVSTLLVFDSGLALPGGAFVPSASLLRELGVRPGSASVTGVGGGGAVTVTPFRFSRLEIGALGRTDVVSVAGAFPETLATRFGTRIGGLVSHGFFAGQSVTLDFDEMTMIVEGEYAAPPRTGPAPPAALARVPADSMVALARTILARLAAKEYDALGPLWSAALLERLPPDKVGVSWEGLVSGLGAPLEIGAAIPVEGRAQVNVPVRFDRVTMIVGLTFDGDGGLTGFSMQAER
jgi:hypothetical protein